MKRYDDPKTQDKLFAFNRVKNHSFLPYRERAVLSFYAENYTWSEDQASYWSQQKICDLLGFKSEKTLRSCNKVLEELNWISLDRKFSSTASLYQSVYVQIHIGIDDPSTLDVHRQNLIKQIEKDTHAPEWQRQRDIDYINLHGRSDVEQLELDSAKENFKNHHPNIYSREAFLESKEKDSRKDLEITY